MQRSSETIGTVAGALAKAQAELTNPEKSLVATIRTDGPGRGVERSFRYAPLSSGLEIVRKALSHHEIATVQTTAVDQAAGIITLTTVLSAFVRGVDRLRLAGLRHQRDGNPASDGRGAHLCAPLCALHPGRDRRGGRHRCSRSQCADPTSASGPNQAASTKNKGLNGGQPQSWPQQIRHDRNAGERGTRASPRSFPPLLDPEASSALS